MPPSWTPLIRDGHPDCWQGEVGGEASLAPGQPRSAHPGQMWMPGLESQGGQRLCQLTHPQCSALCELLG